MNGYYIAAAICVFLGAFLGYLGSIKNSEKSAQESRQASKEQSERIEGELKALGNKIQELQSDRDVTNKEAEIAKVESEYKTLAEEFYRKLPIEVEEFKGRSATKTIHQLELSRKIEQHVHTLENAARGLTKALTTKNPNRPITVNVSDFPTNIYSTEARNKYSTLLSFSSTSHWTIRFVWYPDGTPALEFMRLTSKDEPGKDRQFFITTDSIQLILRGTNFGVSLNERISPDLRERIQKDVKLASLDMDRFDEIARSILETILKYELVQQSLS